MSHYRLYFMDSFNGHIESFQEFEAATDEEAVAVAIDQEGPRALELWNQHRKVARIEPVSLTAQLLERRRRLADAEAGAERPKLTLVATGTAKAASSH